MTVQEERIDAAPDPTAPLLEVTDLTVEFAADDTDFPEPDSPTRPSASPSRMSKLMPSTAVIVPILRRRTTPLVTG